ncbi:arabinose operon transcriptional regulator AraC [Pasteurellaceae bacterium USgator11]|nr:arabinose operon transcriptional regulator AraC [Pasteurellaceae bacterium USgator41]TNG95677.1 arabinose operon transcriptional regulator AraC [Pasteurellaceae bacterium UScroc12]TNG98198.1 arabinose operon transcriptional regulator AraC [Pasteurellaceae bacterium UScroc31]TNH01952.1 arabinose operon transcriptional regulator AraC [Pasteurellaceae bacterium USgator11]
MHPNTPKENIPLLSDYPFDMDLVAGRTLIEKDNYLDYIINRPQGMKGYIINLTTRGRGAIFDGEKTFLADKGDLLLFSPQTIHHYCREPAYYSWYHQWIYFRPRTFWIDWLRWSSTENGIGRLSIQDKEEYQAILDLFVKIENLSKANDIFAKDTTMCFLELLLIKCAKLDPKNLEHKSHNELDLRIDTVCNLILNDLQQNHKIDYFAKKVNLSTSRLTHLFSEQLGMSLTQWRDNQRMENAKKLLYTSDISIMSIAKQLGFDDQFYFSKVFKKYCGTSPSRFRHSR